MGNIKPTYIKRVAQELLEKHRSKFRHDFEFNKQMVQELTDVRYKKLRNRVAGYITKKMRKPID